MILIWVYSRWIKKVKKRKIKNKKKGFVGGGKVGEMGCGKLIISLNGPAEKGGGAAADDVDSGSLLLNQGSTLPCDSTALSL